MLGLPTYALGQREREIRLIVADAQAIRLGAAIDLGRGTEKEVWTVIKIFPHDQYEQIEALVKLMGFPVIRNLFQITAA